MHVFLFRGALGGASSIVQHGIWGKKSGLAVLPQRAKERAAQCKRSAQLRFFVWRATSAFLS